jgi:hypothetical protein
VLEKSGPVEIEKGYAGQRGRTWIHLTQAGKQALHSKIAQLKRLIGQVEQTTAGGSADGGRSLSGAADGAVPGASPPGARPRVISNEG